MIQNQSDNPPASDMPDFLAHGGEMGRLISSQDWRDSPLGPIDSWPCTLKSMLATLLSCPQPFIMGWGPQFFSFFNDSYRPMLGKRFDGVLGQPGVMQWVDSWSEIEPMARRALKGEGSYCENVRYTLTRNGYKESTWWTLSFMPFRDEYGVVAGVYCLPVETTQKVLAEQRRVAVEKRQAFRVEFNDALAGISDLPSLMVVSSRMLGQFLQADCVGFGEMDESGENSHVHEDWTSEGFPSVAGAYRLDDYGLAMMAELRAGCTVVVNDTATDPMTACASCQTAYEPIQTRSFVCAPLIKEGRLAMSLFVLSAAPRVWTECEKELIEEIGERTWAALQRLRTEVDLRHTNTMLDLRTTELLYTESALRQSQKLEALGQLTGGVAHDFNNLLAVISSSVELLRSEQLPVERHGHFLDRIYETVGRAARLTSQLLAFARQQPLRPEAFDVDAQVKGVVDFVRPLMGAQVEIRYESCGNMRCFAEADISQFETALVNLAINARDAMNAKGVLTITVRPVDCVPDDGSGRKTRAGDFVAISVIDTGCGIAPEKLDSIFEPFYTTKEVGKGTGLGLSQVIGFAKQSGGEVDVKSELGRGSVFTLYLAGADDVPPERAAETPRLADNAGCGKCILVVEDSDMLAQMTCEILDSMNYRSTWAANATAALALLAQDHRRFDLVFSDVIMPGMNGIEFGERVKSLYPGLPVVLTSGYNAVMAEQGRHGFELVLKPYTSDALARVFARVVAENA